MILITKGADLIINQSVGVDAMCRSLIYFMKSAGEEKHTEEPSDGQAKITSRGLSVFVNEEEIKLDQGYWVNANKSFNSLEDAVKDAVSRA